MSNEHISNAHSDKPEIYQIRIKGHLEAQWVTWFEGLTITLEDNGNTLLTGHVVDQSELYGLLKKVRDLGMALVSVNPIQSNRHEKGENI